MEISDDLMAVANGNNEFAIDLYARLLHGDKSANLFFSPYSVSTALAMTCAGAKGQTEADMAKVLHFPLRDASLHATFKTLRNVLTFSDKTPGFQLRIANRLWGQKGCHFLPTFLRVTHDSYGADLGLLDFKQTDVARQTINSWVEEQTDRRIQDLLAPGVLDANTRLVLTNAIYFKARWTHEFSKTTTADVPFHISGSHLVTVPMMHETHCLSYGVIDDVQILELPYAENGDLSMLVLLPKTIDGLSDLEKRLTCENLQKWSSGLQSRHVKVHLPKFKMTAEFSLKDMLGSMGMSLAFSDKADFSAMSIQEQLFLSAVIHKAFLDVNEEGTEAAAATGVAMRALAVFGHPEDLVEFRADHPFVFIIRDSRTQSILFLGRLANPNEGYERQIG